MMTSILDKTNGALFVKWTDIFSDKPIARSMWWPVVRASGYLPCWFEPESTGEYCRQCGQRKDSVVHNHGGDTLKIAGNDGRFTGLMANGTRYTVEIEPRGQAVKIEENAIPCPKVRAGIQTRFYGGSWQKYLQTRGWVNL